MSNYELISLIISILAIFGTIFTFWFFNLRKVVIKIINEKQIQLLQQDDALGFNMLFMINSTGSQNRFSVIKFEYAEVVFPNGLRVKFSSRDILEDFADGANLKQKIISRNIPFMISGGESIVKTLDFIVPSKITGKFIKGIYSVIIFTTKDNYLKVGPISFSLNQKDVDSLSDYKKTIYVQTD